MNGEGKLRVLREADTEEITYSATVSYEEHVCGPQCRERCINGDPDVYDDPQG